MNEPFIEAFTVKVGLVSPRDKDHNVSYFDKSFCTPTHTIRGSSDTDITEGVDETKIKRAVDDDAFAGVTGDNHPLESVV